MSWREFISCNRDSPQVTARMDVETKQAWEMGFRTGRALQGRQMLSGQMSVHESRGVSWCEVLISQPWIHGGSGHQGSGAEGTVNLKG